MREMHEEREIRQAYQRKMQGLGWNPSGEDEGIEGKVFGREKEMFLSKRKGEKWTKFCVEAI